MGGVFLDDLPGHFVDHAAMGLTSGSNPFSVTLEQAIVAGPTATSVPTFSDTIKAEGSVDTTTAAGIESDLATQSFNFWSGVTGGRTGFTFRTSHSSADPSNMMRWVNLAGTTIANMDINGEITIGTDADDLFIHEKSTGVVTTGNWTPGAGSWDFGNVEPVDMGSFFEMIPATPAGAGLANTGRVRLFLDTGDDTLKYNDASVQGIPVSRVHWGPTAPLVTTGIWINTSPGAPNYKLEAHNGTEWKEFAQLVA